MEFPVPSALVNLFSRLVAGRLGEPIMQTIHFCACPLITSIKMTTARACWHKCFWVASCIAVVSERVSHWGATLPQCLTNGPVQPQGFDMMYWWERNEKVCRQQKENICWQIIVVEPRIRKELEGVSSLPPSSFFFIRGEGWRCLVKNKN